MDHFVFAGEDVVDLLRLFTCALDRPACANVVVNRPGIVVSKLHDDKVAGLQQGHEAIPIFKREVGAAAETSERAIHHVDFLSVEVSGDWAAPSPLPI